MCLSNFNALKKIFLSEDISAFMTVLDNYDILAYVASMYVTD